MELELAEWLGFGTIYMLGLPGTFDLAFWGRGQYYKFAFLKSLCGWF